MGKKRDLANEHIVDLISNMIDYMQGYVGNCNCPYKYKLLGTEEFVKPTKCIDCETCKHRFWIGLESALLDKYFVE